MTGREARARLPVGDFDPGKIVPLLVPAAFKVSFMQARQSTRHALTVKQVFLFGKMRSVTIIATEFLSRFSQSDQARS